MQPQQDKTHLTSFYGKKEATQLRWQFLQLSPKCFLSNLYCAFFVDFAFLKMLNALEYYYVIAKAAPLRENSSLKLYFQ